MPDVASFVIDEHARLRDLRAELAAWLDERGLSKLEDTALVVLSELTTNALLHGGGWARVGFVEVDDGLRIEVTDRNRTTPVPGVASDRSMTGRGLSLVRRLVADWGTESTVDGKLVWADVLAAPRSGHTVPWSLEGLDAAAGEYADGRIRYHVSLGNVPTSLLIAAKSHVDNLVREFTLAAAGATAGHTPEIPEHLARLIEAVVGGFAEARVSIKRQALVAAHAGATHTRIELNLPLDAAPAGEAYLLALDEVDGYCRAMRLLTLETPPQHKVFRRWYVEELITQLRAAAAGEPRPIAQTFEQRLLTELDRVAEAQRATERAARLYAVAGALAGAATPEEVADAVLKESVAALGASGGGLLLETGGATLSVPGTVGYGPDIVRHLESEQADAELPAATALRTGTPMWIESRAERDSRFPELAGLEQTTVAMCAVPLTLRGRNLGALRFSFNEPRLFDEDERRFVLALAAQAAQALDRARLHHDRDEISQALQRSLLPPGVPTIPGLDVAAIYHPFGEGVEVGGDFYDVWEVQPNQWAFAIGDVAGTGPSAAAVTGQVRYTLRALTMNDAGIDPAAAFGILNEVLLRETATRSDLERFCSAIYGVINVNGVPSVTLANAGHPYPVLRAADGRAEELRIDGTLLGVRRDAAIGTQRLELSPGDALVLFTDGLLEARSHDGTFFDVQRVLAAVSAATGDAATIAATLERAVLAHTGGSLGDDVAVLVLRAPA